MPGKKLKRITIKIGTKVLTDEQNRIDREVIRRLAGQILDLVERKIEVIVVSSGAVGAGLGLLSLRKKGLSLARLQAAASVGQTRLMDIYNEYFNERGYIAGQVLLTQEDFNDRERFLNIRYTLNALLEYKAIPVINENDPVSTEEIKCGDNDRLSSLVADLSDSDMLIILSDVDGLYDGDGRVIEHVEAVTGSVKSFCAGKGSEESTGGMRTKLNAVKNATQAGIRCVIARGRRKNVILDIVSGARVGTDFAVPARTLRARKRWIAFGIKAKGAVIVDAGAEKALVGKNKSLLPGGIVGVRGKFSAGDVVEIRNSGLEVIARGLSNYSSEEVAKIMGKRSDRIEAELGYKDYDEVIHKDNLVIVEGT
ncbi:MAG: glutamate 5-kinase [Candidatus Omnitrophota bacterium]